MTEVVRKHPLAECEKCPLMEAACVQSQGLENKTAFVSRSPGSYDARVGIPFANPRGSKAVLDHLLSRHGVDRSSVLLTNVVLCKSDNPPKEAIKACAPRLEKEIENCELVIAGGAEAVDSLTNYRTVTKSRGFSIARTSPVSKKKQRVVVTNNPAAVIRNSDLYPDMVRDFRRAFDPLPPPIFPKVEIIDDPINACSIIRRWQNDLSGVVASDLEWSGKQIWAAGFARSSEKSVVFTVECFRHEPFRELIKQLYESDRIKFVWHNGQSDTSILRQNDIHGRVDEDTFCLSYDLDERPGYHKLEYLLSEHFGWPDYEPPNVTYFKKNGQFKDDANPRLAALELYKYNGLDAAGTLQLYNKFRNDPDLNEAHYRRLIKAVNRFRVVDTNGFNYDTEEACNINEREVYPRLFSITEELREVSKHSLLNPRSPKQVSALYYGEWNLKHSLRDSGKKKFGTSVAKEVRKEITDNRFYCKPQAKETLIKFNEQYERFQRVTKIQGSFIEGLVKRVQKDGKLYCHFNVCGTATGRTSSSDPNFQNIIREGFETIPGIRTLFLPSLGNVLVAGDLSQAELRTCAKLSGDNNLLGIYRDSERSLHRERAAQFYGENYTYEEYVKAKNINFGVTYGQGAAAFAQMYFMPEREAQDYIDSWWREFSTLKAWTKEVGNRAQKDGVVESPFGHRRRFQLITDDNVNEVKREAVSMVAQNVAAWVTIEAICDLVDEGVRVVATVHDSIVADVPEDEAIDVAKFMKETMERQAVEELGWAVDDIPFLADVSIGPNWGALEEMEIDKLAA